jgi:hypothetical protein
MQEKVMLPSTTVARIALLVFLGLSAAACGVIGGIFKTGVWVGALGVILVVVLLVVAVGKMRG